MIYTGHLRLFVELDMCLKREREGVHIEFCWRNFLESGQLEDQGHARII